MKLNKICFILFRIIFVLILIINIPYLFLHFDILMHFNASNKFIMNLRELALPYKILIMLLSLTFILMLGNGYISYYKETRTKSK